MPAWFSATHWIRFFRVEQYQDTAIRRSGYVYQRKCWLLQNTRIKTWVVRMARIMSQGKNILCRECSYLFPVISEQSLNIYRNIVNHSWRKFWLPMFNLQSYVPQKIWIFCTRPEKNVLPSLWENIYHSGTCNYHTTRSPVSIDDWARRHLRISESHYFLTALDLAVNC